jgi:hypothetical protein
MNCDFDNPERKCPRCGFRVSKYGGLPTFKRNCTNPGVGPGTELKRLLARIGIEAKPDCRCNRHAAEMDHRGPDWCDTNLETIIGWLRETYDDRRAKHAKAAVYEADPSKPAPEPMPMFLRLPFVEAAARQMVKLAIRNARRAAGN